MIARLDQLTLNDWISLLCGDLTVLQGGDASEEELLRLSAKLINEYKQIAAPAQAAHDLSDAEDNQKARHKERCLLICDLLCEFGRCSEAKDVLAELDVNVSRLDTDEKVRNEVKGLLDMARYDIEAMEQEQTKKLKKADPVNIRKSMYSEIAYVMTTLRMSFNPNELNAAIYANLVRQCEIRMKQLAKMKSMMPMF